MLCQKDLNTTEAMGYFFVAVAGIDLAIPDPVARLFVELMEVNLFAFRRGWEQRDRARNKRQLQIAFPICTRGHGTTPTRHHRGVRQILPSD